MYIFILVLTILVLWMISFVFQNDFTVPTKSIKKYKNILVVYPHPDDEVLTVGGCVKCLERTSSNTTLLVLTKGEAGESYTKNVNDLKVIRTKELQRASDILGFKDLIQMDLGDGRLEENANRVKNEIENVLVKVKPDLVITYDRAGLYGHTDHIVASEIITKLKTKYGYKLWYSSFPKRVMKLIKLPEHMAKDYNYAAKRQFPTHKVFVGLAVRAKVRAMYAHASQYNSFRSAYPYKFVPLWMYIWGTVYEHFCET